MDFQFNLFALSNISLLDFGQESAWLQNDCVASSESHDMVNAPFQTSMGLGVSTSVGPTSMYSP